MPDGSPLKALLQLHRHVEVLDVGVLFGGVQLEFGRTRAESGLVSLVPIACGLERL